LMAIDDRQLSARKWHEIHVFSRRNLHIGNKFYFKYSLYFRRLNTKNMSSFTTQSNIISYDYFYWIYDKFWSEAVSSQMELW
jgi:hypothetical protein